MSMHLEGPWLSTTSTKKRKEKITKAKQEELERGWRDRNVRLKEMGLPKETFEQYLDFVHGKVKKVARQTSDREKLSATYAQNNKEKKTAKGVVVEHQSNRIENSCTGPEAKDKVEPKSLGLWITGPCSSKPSPVYTGTKVMGIGTMHKSNAVPIFSDDEAKDISRMRR